MNRIELIRSIKELSTSRDKLPEGDAVPLFWTREGDYYVSGPYKLTETEFQELNRRQPCYL